MAPSSFLIRALKVKGALLALAFIVPFGSAQACGGPGVYALDRPMRSVDGMMQWMIAGDDYESNMREEFLFLYPFKIQDPKNFEPLWLLSYAYPDLESLYPAPESELLNAALKSGDWSAAEPLARKIVDDMLAMPSIAADNHQAALIKAVEFLEVKPLLQGMDPMLAAAALWNGSAPVSRRKLPVWAHDVLAVRNLDRSRVDELIATRPNHPRMATLRFVALKNEFARKVPDGWVEEIRGQVPKAVWRELESSTERWLTNYPDHPLADLVRLSKARIYYFEGDAQHAWDLLLTMYPKRKTRVVYDMRYMLKYFAAPPAEALRKVKDPLLFSALLPSVDVSDEEWSRWWKTSEDHATDGWAKNLQERLLEKVVRQEASAGLPTAFPREPRNPTLLWGKLRALALMKKCEWDEARKQLFSLPPDQEQAVLAAGYHLHQGRIGVAAEVIDLPEEVRQYLIRVMADDRDILRLTQAKNPQLRREALFERAVRLAGEGKWTEAADIIVKVDPAKGAIWRQAASLQFDKSPRGTLAWARFLKGNSGNLFYGNDSTWLRSVSERMGDGGTFGETIVDMAPRKGPGRGERASTCSTLPWTKEHEKDAVTQHLVRSSELLLALQAYADWLSVAQPSKEKSSAVKEADACYNRLINFAASSSGFWGYYLEKQDAIATIREAGKRARKR